MNRTSITIILKWKILFIFTYFLTFPAFSTNYIPKGFYVIDLKNKIEWLRCAVGATWQDDKCQGKPIKLRLDQINEVINLAENQLGGKWRLPTRFELENLICKNCKKVKIEEKFFPNTPAEPFWTGEKNSWQPQFYWTVNFFTGHTFGRFPGFIPNYVRLVRDR